MLDFCAQHGITAEIEIIPIQQINEAYERMLKSDVKYRFVIDMASLKQEATA
jgi:alcohol dehydrogenase (NADP+)